MPDPGPDTPRPRTDDAAYAARLVRLQTRSWKTRLDVARVYRWNVTRRGLGRTLDVGCGIGRMLRGLPAGSVGVDHNPHSVAVARAAGLTALTATEWDASELAHGSGFDAMLLSHVVEHMGQDDAVSLVAHYLPAVRPGGTVAFVVPQERGFASDATHVWFVDAPELRALCARLGLEPGHGWSFPLPRAFGRAFVYNETCLLARVPAR